MQTYDDWNKFDEQLLVEELDNLFVMNDEQAVCRLCKKEINIGPSTATRQALVHHIKKHLQEEAC